MFADDVMIFFDGSTNSLHGVSECLDDFSSWSGLVVNTEKTELFTSGLSPTDSVAIARFGFPSDFRSLAGSLRYLNTLH